MPETPVDINPILPDRFTMTNETFERLCFQKVEEYLGSAKKHSALATQEDFLYQVQFLHDLTASMMSELKNLVETGVHEHHLDRTTLMTIIRKHFTRYYNEITAI